MSIESGPIMHLTNDEYGYPQQVECTAQERKQVGFIGNSITLVNVRNAADGRLASKTLRTYASKHQKNYFTVEEKSCVVDRVMAPGHPPPSLTRVVSRWHLKNNRVRKTGSSDHAISLFFFSR